MRVLSVNVGLPRDVPYRGGTVSTGIYKEPVAGRVRVKISGLEGDRQADPAVHGAPLKAVYAYPSEHYAAWMRELSRDLPWGMFGENLTTEGLLETDVRTGDRYRVGTAVLQVTQPRGPCFKLEIRFGRTDIVRRFRETERSGFYLAVLQEGDVAAGDPITRITAAEGEPTIADLVHVHAPGD